jgi:hypothetical protein
MHVIHCFRELIITVFCNQINVLRSRLSTGKTCPRPQRPSLGAIIIIRAPHPLGVVRVAGQHRGQRLQLVFVEPVLVNVPHVLMRLLKVRRASIRRACQI